jgi:DNA helicase-2/ATP-dependent DNA helicase PcrA
LREPVREFFRSTAKAVIVDEVFDGNLVDLRIVAIAAAAGVPTTILGDPWKALYAFRGARPDMVPTLVDQLGFTTFPISESFRFVTQEMQDLAAALREGRPVTVPTGGARDPHVVLASEWSTLWSTSAQVLPFSFGRVGNRVDAAMAVLLDQVVTSYFGELSTFGPDAAVILGLDPATMRAEGASALVTVLDRLSNGTQAQAEAALSLLRETLVGLGSRPIPRLQPAKEAIRVDRLQQLAARLKSTKLVPGLTIHQAKGREWEQVGVALTAAEYSRLAAGLSQASATDRALYVALTRAKRYAFSVQFDVPE